MYIYRCDITLLEPTFFSSREVSNNYYTEPFIGNYALAYALGLVHAPYFNDGTIHYPEHLQQLNEVGIYVTPGTLQSSPRFVFGQFNAQADAYWFAFANNAIVTRPDGSWVEKSGPVWYVHRPGEPKPQKVGLENRPQFGTIRALGIGNKATAYVLSPHKLSLPSYIRLGKFMSKAHIQTTLCPTEKVTKQQLMIDFLLNPADLPADYSLTLFDLLNVPPTPLIYHTQLSGTFYALPHQTYLPVGLRFGLHQLP